MSNAIVVKAYGGPEVMEFQAVPQVAPQAGEVRIRHTRIGVNFHDIYVRSGEYKTLALPGTPGIEGVGVVEHVGDGVSEMQVGDRVAYVTGAYGVYASHRVVSADQVLRIPDDLADEQVASAFLRGLTVEMLVNRAFKLERGQTALIHAAAGGVGQLLARWAKHAGAVVIGMVRKQGQELLARQAGCDSVLVYSPASVKEIMELTGGRGVDVVYDGVGQSTFDLSLEVVALCGHVVNFGQASGAIAPFTMSRLAAKSTTLSRPIIFHYLREPSARKEMAANVFSGLEAGWLCVSEAREFPLREAADSHRMLQKEGASRPILLVP